MESARTLDLSTLPIRDLAATGGPSRYYTASDGSKLAQSHAAQAVPVGGRRRVPTGYCHAVAWWAPARTLCGLLTERMALWPHHDFLRQQVQVCLTCLAVTAAKAEPPPDDPS